MGKLTRNQIDMLREISAATYEDGSGAGKVMLDGMMARTASSLHRRGLVTLPSGHGVFFGGFLGVKITEAGRQAIKDHSHE